MLKPIRIAAIQLNARPAPNAERLRRAEDLIAQAADTGAQLAVLPEVFNTGYEYSRRNYDLAEPLDGPTGQWMRRVAAQYRLHLAGTFLRRDGVEIYNTLLLVAPEGRQWLYDKNYPWMWERAYFRNGCGITVADTELGKIGLMVCWDVAHVDLWRRYAGKVGLVVVSSCPPMAHEMRLRLPDDSLVTSGDLGPLLRQIGRSADGTFGPLLRRQAAHLGVPMVSTTTTGAFVSRMPCPRASLAIYALAYPRLWKYLSQAGDVSLESSYFQETYIADAGGNVIRSVLPGVEGYAIAEVVLPEIPPKPRGKQPLFGISRLAYWMDAFANGVMVKEYERKLR
jgi:predicted amidohydrolase